MADMPHWNALVKRVLSEKQDKPDKGDKVAFANSLTSKKEQEKEGKNEQ